jgi:glycosyltransferase involved in cell wall biosynthesis
VLAPRASALVANSKSVALDLERSLHHAPTPEVIYNAVDTNRFSPDGGKIDLDEASGLPPAGPGCIRVGLVATFARWKGHDIFLRALATLPATPQVRGYIVGGGQYRTTSSQVSREELVSIARSLGIRNRLGFVEFQRDTAPVYRALDVAVHASTAPEPFGLALVEAMACGRAVVFSAAGGALEAASDGVTALAHLPGDSGQLAEAIRCLAQDSGLRWRLGVAARQSVCDRFSRARLGSALARAYERLAGGAAL